MQEFRNELARLGLIKTHEEETKTKLLTNVNRELAKVLIADVELFAYEVDAKIRNMHPAVKELIIRKAEDILDAMRSANMETKNGFGGMTGSANALDVRISWAYDYIDPDVVSAVPTAPATDNRRTWTRFIAAVDAPATARSFITGAVAVVGTPVDLVLAEEESMVFLGFTNRAGVDPKSTAYSIFYNTEELNYQPFNFELAETKEQDLLLHEMPQSVLIPPEQRIHIDVRYDQTGTDYLMPIVFRFRQASDSRNL